VNRDVTKGQWRVDHRMISKILCGIVV
jgi:hypothetical protein